MPSIAANAAIAFSVAGSAGEWVPRTPDDVRSAAVSGLSLYGVVNPLTITKLSSRLPLSTIDLWDWRYTATGVITTRYGHASIEDLRKVIADVFWSAAGEPVTVAFPNFGEIVGSGIDDQSPDATNKLLGVGAVTIVAAVGLAVFVAKRG
jgi:hypothetical protein